MQTLPFIFRGVIITLVFLPVWGRGLLQAQNKSDQTPDTARVRELGADLYGMRQYVFLMLKTGPVRDQDEKTVMQLQKDHLGYLYGLMEKGKLLVLGPLMAGSDIQGICIYNTATVEEAKSLAEQDPMVKSGRLVVEAYPWYSTAALLEVPGIHKTIETRPFSRIME